MIRTIAVLCALSLVACSKGQLSSSQQTDLSAIINDMVTVASTAGGITDGYSAVWSAAIQSSGDFNERLREHRDSVAVKGEIAKLDTQFASLEDKIKASREGGISESLFRELGDAYELLARLRMLATTPTGSLQSFNANSAELANRLGGAIGRLKLHQPPSGLAPPK